MTSFPREPLGYFALKQININLPKVAFLTSATQQHFAGYSNSKKHLLFIFEQTHTLYYQNEKILGELRRKYEVRSY